MSDSTTIGSTEVAAFLRRNPRFLNEYPDLALGLVVPREEGRATSLASYQLDVLRDKNRELNKRLLELFHNAQENERLTVRIHQLVLALMRARDAASTLKSLVASLAEDFQGDIVRVVLHAPVPGLDGADWLQVLPRDAAVMSPFGEFFDKDEPLCGRLQQEKFDTLFGARVHEVQSTALIPLGTRGLAAIGSHDPNRFYPGMGTLFLRLLGDTLVAALERYDG